MLIWKCRRLRDLEIVFDEISLGIPKVRAVEPYVTLVAKAIYDEPASVAFWELV